MKLHCMCLLIFKEEWKNDFWITDWLHTEEDEDDDKDNNDEECTISKSHCKPYACTKTEK